MSRFDYRKYVPAPENSRIHGGSAKDHAAKCLQSARIQEILSGWQEMYDAPYKGITVDGHVTPGLYSLRAEEAPAEQAIIAANYLISLLTSEQAEACRFDISAKIWRKWQNTEIYMEDYGLRLAEVSEPTRLAILEILRASLGPKGYEKSRNVMRLNSFLGDLLGGPEIFGEFTYLFCLFGTPSLTEPWGWQLFGHHLCLSCVIVGDQMIITPTFMGGEPISADAGPHKGLSIFEDEERDGLALMQSFSNEQQGKALIANSMVGGDLPKGRRVPHDGLHYGGAFCDNRIVPYEGLAGGEFNPLQRRDLLDLIGEYLCTLPKGPFEAKMVDVERHFTDTHFCWIGSREVDQAFYYRIQSPVTFIEFDHHAGVYMTNQEPMTFHVHSLVRTPNGNDYGIDLIRQHYESSPHHQEQHHHNED